MRKEYCCSWCQAIVPSASWSDQRAAPRPLRSKYSVLQLSAFNFLFGFALGMLHVPRPVWKKYGI